MVQIHSPRLVVTGSVLDTWVTVYSEDIGNTFGPKGILDRFEATGLVAPDSNEAIGALLQRYPDLGLGKALAPDAAGFLYIEAAKYPEVFANGLPQTQARAFATAQKPIAGSALGEPLTVAPAWKIVPSWYVVATQDRAINPELERFMAKRMNARVTELPAGHLVFISRAQDIARIIESASQ